MPNYQISARAELTNISSLSLPSTFNFRFVLTCTSCHEAHPSPVEFTSQDVCEASHQRSTSNFVMKCKFCGHLGTLNVVMPMYELNANENTNGFQKLVVLEGRGWEPTSWLYNQDGYVAKGEKSSTFEVDLTDEWCDYDEETGQEVSVMSFEYMIGKA